MLLWGRFVGVPWDAHLRTVQQAAGQYVCWMHLHLQIEILNWEKWNWQMLSRKSCRQAKQPCYKLCLPVWLCLVYLAMLGEGNVPGAAWELCPLWFGTSSQSCRIGRCCNDSCGVPSARVGPCRWVRPSWNFPVQLVIGCCRLFCCWLRRRRFGCAPATFYQPAAFWERSHCWCAAQQESWSSGWQMWVRQRWYGDFEIGRWCNCWQTWRSPIWLNCKPWDGTSKLFNKFDFCLRQPQLSKEGYDQVFFYCIDLFFSCLLVELWSGPFCKCPVLFCVHGQQTKWNQL